MPILNYTTEVRVEQSIMEIEHILAKYGATSILKDFDENGACNAITFKIMTAKGELPFKLPMKVREMQQIINDLVNDKKLPKKFYNDKEKAMKVGWRILRSWLEAQMALLELQFVKIEEVLLPYMYSAKDKKTFFELIEERNFNIGLLEKKGENE